jgi:hypothetical protein
MPCATGANCQWQYLFAEGGETSAIAPRRIAEPGGSTRLREEMVPDPERNAGTHPENIKSWIPACAMMTTYTQE